MQSMADASPTKWHRAHVTWFFEQFLLVPHDPGYKIFDERFPFLFNSYYVAAGPRHARPQRGLITRLNGADVAGYRAHDAGAVEKLIANVSAEKAGEVFSILEIGLHHEQQHQELLITDILHAFAQNPTDPVYDANWQPHAHDAGAAWLRRRAVRHSFGRARGRGLLFRDNELPFHDELIPESCRIARHLVSNAEWIAFMASGGWLHHTVAVVVGRLVSHTE